MALYPIGKKKWKIVIHSKGNRIDRSFEGSKAEAFEAEASLRLNFQKEHVSNRVVCPDFRKFVEAYYTPNSKLQHAKSTRTVRSSILKHLKGHFGVKKLDTISTQDVEEYAQERLDVGIQASSVNNELRVLGAILKQAGNKYDMEAVVQRISEKGRGNVKYWTPEEMSRLLSACKEVAPRLLPLVTFLANTGCRKGEALWLRWANIDLERQLVHLEPTPEWKPKSGKGRTVPMPGALVAYFSGPRLDAEFCFPSRAGGRRKSFPVEAFEKVLDAAGLTGSPHKCRHSFASAFLSKKPDLFLLSNILGHADVKTTQIYAHLMPNHMSQAVGVVSF